METCKWCSNIINSHHYSYSYCSKKCEQEYNQYQENNPGIVGIAVKGIGGALLDGFLALTKKKEPEYEIPSSEDEPEFYIAWAEKLNDDQIKEYKKIFRENKSIGKAANVNGKNTFVSGPYDEDDANLRIEDHEGAFVVEKSEVKKYKKTKKSEEEPEFFVAWASELDDEIIPDMKKAFGEDGKAANVNGRNTFVSGPYSEFVAMEVAKSHEPAFVIEKSSVKEYTKIVDEKNNSLQKNENTQSVPEDFGYYLAAPVSDLMEEQEIEALCKDLDAKRTPYQKREILGKTIITFGPSTAIMVQQAIQDGKSDPDPDSWAFFIITPDNNFIGYPTAELIQKIKRERTPLKLNSIPTSLKSKSDADSADVTYLDLIGEANKKI
jgi:hypothetical protein